MAANVSPALMAAAKRRSMMSGGGMMEPMMENAGGAPPMMDPDPSLLAKLWQFFRAGGDQPAGQEAADAMNAKLPDQLSARKALMKKRRQQADMDAMLREE